MTRARLLPPARLTRAAAALLATGSLLVTGALAAPSADAAPTVKVSDGRFVIKGAGYGHGHGMSQWGAYGAARQGLSWKQILDFYYPGATLTTLSTKTSIKVWISADDDDNLRVLPAKGLKVSDGHHHELVLPTGSQYRSWRIKRAGSGYKLSWKDAKGKYHTLSTPLDKSTWRFSVPGAAVKVRMPSGTTREYRGSMWFVKRGTSGRTVNKVRLEDYARSVVPSEMPTSWAKDAVRVQAVAARSFALRSRDAGASGRGYDVCDTTNCQVYGGKATTTAGGRRTVRETKGGDAAVRATAGVILTYKGKAALTQFGPSNGGALASGGMPYLVRKKDPYDGLLQSQTWSRTITAAALERAYPSAGTITALTITKRDGTGRWGGRVVSISVVGSKKTIKTSGGAFQGRFGMRSSLFTVTS